MQMGLVIPGATAWLQARHQILVLGMWKIELFEMSKNWFWQINKSWKI